MKFKRKDQESREGGKGDFGLYALTRCQDCHWIVRMRGEKLNCQKFYGARGQDKKYFFVVNGKHQTSLFSASQGKLWHKNTFQNNILFE